MPILTIKNEQLCVSISTLGAQIQSIRDAQGNERLWQGDPAFWTGRAPILFPVAGGLKDDAYLMDGVRYEMPKHGFVRTIEWTVAQETPTEVAFAVTETHPGFPFLYTLVARFALTGNTLSTTYTVENRDDKPFSYGIGAHEAYRTLGDISDYTLVFDCVEDFDHHMLEGNLIRTAPIRLASHTNRLPLHDLYFAVDALVFPALTSRGVTLLSERHPGSVYVTYPGHDVLMVWKKPGAHYLCIEPWINAPDYMDHDGDIAHKAGCVRLLPGTARHHTHTATFC